MSPQEVRMAERYEELAVQWVSALSEARKANRLFDALHKEATRLKATSEGRKSLEALMSHENRAVRLNAASVCLQWDPDAGRSVLEALITPRGTHSLTAEVVLRELDAGTLAFDW